eukprot:s2655_g9.t1
MSYAHVGVPDVEATAGLFVDAQGNPLRTAGIRIAENQIGRLRFRERFVISDVVQPLVSLGKLYRAGWFVAPQGDGLFLTDGNQSERVGFRKQSLCVHGTIRVVTECGSINAVMNVLSLDDSLEGAEACASGPPESLEGAPASENPEHSELEGAEACASGPPESLEGAPASENPEHSELPVEQRDELMPPESIEVDGVIIDSDSSLEVMRNACKALGLPENGKKKLRFSSEWESIALSMSCYKAIM